jgi:hypothetical protein
MGRGEADNRMGVFHVKTFDCAFSGGGFFGIAEIGEFAEFVGWVAAGWVAAGESRRGESRLKPRLGRFYR